MSGRDDAEENWKMLNDPNYSGPAAQGGYATVKGDTPSAGEDLAIHGNNEYGINYGNGGVQTNFTNRGGRYAGIGFKYGGRDTGAAGSDVGSYDYQKDIWKQRMYETGGSTWEVDPSSQFFNGDENWAPDYYNDMTNQAQVYGDRQAPQMTMYTPDMTGFENGMSQADMGRMAQTMAQTKAMQDLNVLGMDVNGIRNMAMGYGQSAAEMAMQRQAEDAFRQNMAMASSARGAGANAALLQAAQQNAVGQGQLTRDLGIQRASEQMDWTNALLQGEGQYMGAQDAITDNYGDIRGQDLQGAEMQGDMAMNYAQTMADQEATKVATDVDVMNANDSMVQFFTAQGYSAMEAQMLARQAFEANRTSNWLQKYGVDTGAPQEESYWDKIGNAAITAGGYVVGNYFGGKAASSAASDATKGGK